MNYTLYNLTKRQSLMAIRRAGTFWERFWGLLFAGSKGQCPAIWLVPCRAIHTFGMRWSVDLVFLSRDLEVVQIKKNIKPFSFPVWCRKAYSVLEVPSGRWDSDKVDVGDKLEFQ